MTSQDIATIQNASTAFWTLAGSQLFVLADRSGQLVAIHTATPGFTAAEAQESLMHSVENGESRGWWFAGGRLFEVFLQPIYFGSPEGNTPIGILGVGYEIDRRTADGMSQVASTQVAFRYGHTLVASTVPAADHDELAARLEQLRTDDTAPREMALGPGRFLATSVRLSADATLPVTLTVLRSFDEATAFLQNLNRWILAIGLAAVLAGSVLVFVVSTTFTRPLAQLVAGVRALEEGDYTFPLTAEGTDEISDLTVELVGHAVDGDADLLEKVEPLRLAPWLLQAARRGPSRPRPGGRGDRARHPNRESAS